MLKRWIVLAAITGATGLLASLGCGSRDGAPPIVAIGGTEGAGGPKAGSKRPARTPEDLAHPKVLIQTSLGDMTVELEGQKAPLTVQNFLAYVEQGHFDQTLIHQVVANKVIVAGTYDAQRREKKTGIPVRNEAHNGLKNVRGTLAMARRHDSVDSATSQFFINLADNAWLDHRGRTLDDYGYCVFGRVIAGMEVLDRIAAVAVQNVDQLEMTPVDPVTITSVRRVP